MAEIPQDRRQTVPWVGPTEPTVTITTSYGNACEFPFDDATVEFPPVCLRSHWDPEQIIRRTLPNGSVRMPLDPRPWTKICTDYVTSADFEESPRPDDDIVFPSGGSVYPPSRFREAIDRESKLRRLDRPLGVCERSQYIPPITGDMYRPNSTVPDRDPTSTRFIEELSFPQACMRSEKGNNDCRISAEQEAWQRSPRMFNNTTKQDRYAESRPDLAKPRGSAGPRPFVGGIINA